MTAHNSDWDADAFFSSRLAKNRLAKAEGFRYFKVSGLNGFEDALNEMQRVQNFFCLSDVSDGYTELNNTPRTRRVKTVFMAMRHPLADMEARAACIETMRELFRQLMTALLRERQPLACAGIYIDPRITFKEIDRYFFSGGACAHFQVAVDNFTDLRYRADEWD